MSDPKVTPLRCQMLGHDFDYVKTANGFKKRCTRCDKPWDEEVDG